MAYQKQTWREYDDNKTEVVNMNQGAVVTPERLNHMETGIANSADKATLEQLEVSVGQQLAQNTSQVTNAYKSSYKSSASVGNDTPSLRIVFKDDDGMAPVLTRLKDLSVEKNVPWTIGLIRDSDVLSTRENINATLDLQNNLGWEIAAHTYHHERLSTYTEAQLIDDFEKNLQQLRSEGFDVNNLIYPFGDHNDLVQKVASKYFRSASRTGDLVHNRFDRMEMFSLKRVSIPYGSYYSTTLEALKGRVDTALSDNNGENLLIFCTHVWGMTEEDWQMLSDLLDYINSLNIPCVTMNDALDEFAPVTYTGYWNDPDHFQLLPNGKILSNRAKTKVAPENSHSASDTLLDFEPDTVTITAINNAQADGLPNNAAGLLTTNRIASTNAYSYQLFQEYGNDKLYIRKATSPSGVFQPWSEIAVSRYGVSKVTTVNAHDGNTPLSAFPIGLTHNGVNDAQAVATNLPNGKSGMLMTYRSYADSIQAYAYQTYQEYNSQKLHIRTASTSGAWQAWHEITTSREGAHVADVANKYTASTPIASFPKGITTHAITSGNTTGLPDGSPGLLTTYKVQTNGFFRQEFRKYLSNEVWSRFADEAGAWTTWVKISAV